MRSFCRQTLCAALLSSVLVALGACGRPPAPIAVPKPRVEPAPARAAITNGEQVLRLMHDRYAGHWYHSLTFSQKTTQYLPGGGTLVQTWYEAGLLPGRLRIDIEAPSKGNGVLYANDSTYSFQGGRLVNASRRLNDLLLLGFDVYAEPVERTVALLRGEGFDLSKAHEGTWEGRPAYVVGAAAGDTTSKQFWIEQERLLFVRLVDARTTPQGVQRQDLRFESYVQHGGGWVAERVTMLANGKPRLTEEYADVRVDVPLSEALFDPRQWSTAPHWVRP